MLKGTHANVGIIGGGLAGVYLASQLAKNNISYKLIESKSKLGGRIYAENTYSQSYQMDLGPSWIFPHQHRIQKLVSELGLALVEQFNSGDAIFQRSLVEEPQQISGVAPPTMYRILGGTSKLIDTLAESVDKRHVFLSRTADSLQFDGQFWQVHSSAQNGRPVPQETELDAFEHLVIATPPRVIANKISYVRDELNEPSLFFEELTQKFSGTPTWMAAQAKFAITFKQAFWREKGLSGQAFSHTGPMVEIHDASFEDGSQQQVFALFGFIGIPFPQRQQISTEEMKRACISQLVILFGEQAYDYVDVYYKDWGSDAFTATISDQQQASVHPHIDLKNEQTQMVKMNLHLAASEFAQSEAGYMEGAIVAAQAAVDAIMSKM